MPELHLNGLSYHLRDEGRGQPVLLIHGFPDTSALWEPQLALLTQAGYRAIAPDMRGRGRTEQPANVDDYALRHIVADMLALLDALDIERAHVVGHDWGAAVAWLLAGLHPERVERLVAISVGFPGAAGRPTLESLQLGWYRLLIQFTGIAEDLFQRDDWYLLRELLEQSPRAEQAITTLSQPGALTASFNWYRANLPPEALMRPARPLPVVRAQTLGIFGQRDAYLTEWAMTQSAQHVSGDWRYECFSDAGHWLMLDEPARFNALLLEFLST
jgi:pimeloyl-ACP methyl ester carboxylesterase